MTVAAASSATEQAQETVKTPHFRIEVVAGILWQKDVYLAAQRPMSGPLGGFWEFPGGKVEAGESLEQALQRELQEELDVQVQQCRFWKSVEHNYPQRLVRVHFFHVLQFTGQPRALEGQNIAWVTPSQGAKMKFLEADIPLVHELAQKSFS